MKSIFLALFLCSLLIGFIPGGLARINSASSIVPIRLHPVVNISTDVAHCAGFFVPGSKTKIVTAAHCVLSEDDQFLGNINVAIYTSENQLYTERRIATNLPIYIADFDRKKRTNDFVLMQISEPLGNIEFVHYANEDIGCFVHYFDGKNNSFLSVAVDRVSSRDCTKVFKLHDHTVSIAESSQICAVDSSSTIKKGFSGSPLICGGNVIGTLSYGPGEFGNGQGQRPIVFTKLKHYEYLFKPEGQAEIESPVVLLVLVIFIFVLIALVRLVFLRLWKKREVQPLIIPIVEC